MRRATPGNDVTTVTDQMGRERTTHKYIRDNILAVTDPNGVTTTYSYSVLGKIQRVRDAVGNETTMKYDGFGRRTEINNPDTGRTRFTYDSAGNMTRKITAEPGAKGKLQRTTPRLIRTKMKRHFRVTRALLFLLLVFDLVNSSTEVALTDARITWKFAVISDTQNDYSGVPVKSCINDKILGTIAADIASEAPEFVLVSGDLVNGWLRHDGRDYAGQYNAWKEAMYPVLNSGIKVYPVRGNHDSGPELYAVRPLPEELELSPVSLDELEQAYREQIINPLIPENGPECEEGFTFSVLCRNALVIGLDQYAGRQHRVNQEWLDATLAVNDRLHVFIFGHEPAFKTDHRDNLSFFPKDRDLFWDSIGKAGARIYFCGHDHFYNRALVPDRKGNVIWQVTAGTGGGELQDWSGSYGDGDKVECEYHNDDYYGYVLVTVDGPDVNVRWKALVDPDNKCWQVMDEFSYSVGHTDDMPAGL